MANVYQSKGDYDLALKYYAESLDIFKINHITPVLLLL
jgi:hypothetical protein